MAPKPRKAQPQDQEGMDVEQARRVMARLEHDRNARVQAFTEELRALCEKYRVELNTGPVDIIAVAQD